MKMKKVIAGILSTCMIVTTLANPAFVMETQAARSGEEKVVKSGADNPLRLWYNKPASKGTKILSGGTFGTSAEDNQWQQFTLPIGNSYMGANVYGEIASERLTFNQKTLWNGGPSSTKRPNYNGGNLETASNGKKMTDAYQDVIDALKRGENADSLCDYLVGTNDGYGAYQSWGDIFLTFAGLSDGTVPADYNRDLDLNSATANVDFTIDGTQYHREYFISHPDNVLAMKLTAVGKNKLNFNVSFPVDNAPGELSNNQTLEQRKLGKEVTYTTTKDTLVTAGKMQDNNMLMNSMVKVVPKDGSVASNANQQSLDIQGASEVVIFVAADTDYKNEYPSYRTKETPQELAKSVEATITKALETTYDTVKENHVKDYQNIFNRVDLNLGQNEVVSDKPTDELLAGYKANTASEEEKRQLEVMLYQYGRFLTIESSREGDLPANLQGVWQNRSGDAGRVPWGSDYHMNVNLQMNYWPTYSANMAECAIPLIDYVESLREPGRVTVKSYYGIESKSGEANGFTAHTQNTPFGWTCPGDQFSWGWSPAAVPWIIQNCWEYYEYTGDVEFMRTRLYPMMKEQAKLYEQILEETDMEITLKDGTKSNRLVSAPTFSPEQGPRTLGNTYEQGLIWQLFEDVVIAAEVLGVDAESVKDWNKIKERLAPIEIGDSGQIKEWYIETTLGSIPSEKGHRHMSHLLGLFPGDLISVDNDDYMDAAIVSLKDRGFNATGWGIGQRINTWARTGDGENSYTAIKTLFRTGVYPNLFDTHPPFQIDGNFGYTSGVNEMLMQSNMGYINVLPAIPDEWANGSVEGIVARGNFELGMEWTDGKPTKVRVLSQNGGDCTVQALGISTATITDSNGEAVTYEKAGRDRIKFASIKGKTYTISNFAEVPDAPKSGSAVYVGGDGVELSWAAVEGEDVTYNVYRNDGNGLEQIAENISEASYADKKEFTTAPGNLKYKITAVVNGVESLHSETISVSDLTIKGMVDDAEPRVVFSQGWNTWNKDPRDYNTTLHFIDTPLGTETVSLTFSGTGIRVIGPRNVDHGYMSVIVDGVEQKEKIDCYAPNDLHQQILLELTGLTDGKHDIKLMATGTKNDKSTSTKVEVDAFQVLGDKYDIIYTSDKEGTSGQLPANVNDYEGNAITLPAPGITVRGYNFVGWNDGNKTYAQGTVYRIPKNGATLNAVWDKAAAMKIPSNQLSAVADSEENQGTDGPAGSAIDGNVGTWWHSAWSPGKQGADIPGDRFNTFTITLPNFCQVNKFEYVPRSIANGRILGYKLYYSPDVSGDNFVEVPGGEGTWEANTATKSADFAPVAARRIKIKATKTLGGSVPENDQFISAAEFYVYRTFVDIEVPNYVAVTGVSMLTETASVAAGKTTRLEAVVAPENATYKEVSWVSEDPQIATVNDNGVVTGVREGEVNINAITDDGSKKAVCTVSVTPSAVEVTGVTVDPTSFSIASGGRKQLRAAVEPVNATNKEVKWESEDTLIATVDATGLVTAIAPGETDITVTTVSGEKTAVSHVTVLARLDGARIPSSELSAIADSEEGEEGAGADGPASYAVDGNEGTHWHSAWSHDPKADILNDINNSITINLGGTYEIDMLEYLPRQKADAFNGRIMGYKLLYSTEESGTDNFIEIPNGTGTWGSEIEKKQATFEPVTARRIQLRVTQSHGGKQEEMNQFISAAEFYVYETYKAVTGVKATPDNATLEVDQTIALTATVLPENATNKKVAWRSENPLIASVDENGVVTALAAGETSIAVTTDDGDFVAKCSVTVHPKPVAVTGVTLAPATTSLEVGRTVQLTPTVLPAGATNNGVSWKSSNTAFASVDGAGLVTAKSEGSATITVTTTDGGYTATCNVTVTPKVINVTGVTVSPTTAELVEGKTQQLTAAVTPSNATNKEVRWSSDNNGVASVSGGGLVTAVKKGTAVITATTVDGGRIATCTVTVTAKVIPVDSISVTPDMLELQLGAVVTADLTATITPSTATNKNVSWSSDNNGVATVANGKVTAVSPGTARITATALGGTNKTDQCIVTVKEKEAEVIRVTGITLDQTSAEVKEGKTITLNHEVLPRDAANKNVTWSSEFDAVATVENGVVTGISEGTADITVTTEDGSFTAVCKVTVSKEEAPKPIPVTGVSVTPDKVSIVEGNTASLQAQVQPANAANQKVSWTSENPAVAAVGVSGVVTAVKAGTAKITVTTEDGSKQASCIVTVTPKPVTKYSVVLNPAGGTVSPTSLTVEAGKAYGNLPTPVRSGYIFLGWYLDNTKVSDSTICNSNVTLTAKWEINKPGKVTGVKASKQTTDSIKITWKKVTGATSYTVSRYDYSKKKWSSLKSTKNTSLTDTGRKTGTKYKYRVLASNSTGKGSYSSTITTSTSPSKPSLSAKKSGSNKVKLTWKKVSKASGYEIYMKTNKGDFKKLTSRSAKTTSYTKSVKKGSTYSFKIRAYIKAGSNVYSKYSKTYTFKIK